MRGPVIAVVAVALAGSVFVVVNEPSSPGSRVHDWLAVAYVAGTAGVFYGGGTAPRRRMALVAVAYALFVATTFAWFVESAVLWVAVGVALGLAIECVRRVRRTAP